MPPHTGEEETATAEVNAAPVSDATPFTSTPTSSAVQMTFPFSSGPAPVPLPTVCHAWPGSFGGALLQGTCGWTDSSIVKAPSHFYPPHTHNAVDRLVHYSAHFPCVEVDSSNYAIPPPSRVSSWLAATPPGFLFHFKCFGLFTSLSAKVGALPGPLRSLLPPSLTAAAAASSASSSAAAAVRLNDLPASYIDALWQYFNTALLPAHNAGKLGLVIFQFQLSFSPSDASRQHVEWCRRQLCSAYRMGVELRDRRWLKGDERERTLAWLRSLDVAYVVCDDLEQETYRANRQAIGEDARLPVVHATTASHSIYIRLHRRTGDERGDRVLRPHEFVEWADRLRAEQEAADPDRRRAVFFLWGTDCYDDPITNAQRLSEAVRERAAALWLDWKELRRAEMKQRSGGNLIALFAKQEKKNKQREEDSTEREEGAMAREGVGEKRQMAAEAVHDVDTAGAGTGTSSSGGSGGSRGAVCIKSHKEDAASRKRQRLESELANVDAARVNEG